MPIKRSVAIGRAAGQFLRKTAVSTLVKPKKQIPAVAESLCDFAGNLEVECKAVEPAFMQLGQSIQSVYGDLAALGAFIQEVVGQISGASEDSAVAQVKRRAAHSLETLEQSQAGVAASLETITRMADRLGTLCSTISQADKIGMFLKVVSLNIQIESARSKASYEMFTVFSQDVRKLSDKIIEVAGDIREDSAAALSEQQSAHAILSDDLARLDRLVASGRQTVETSLQNSEGIMALSVDILHKASEHARTVTDAVGEVVVGVQLHDNLSQRVDHIARAMEDAG